MTDLFPVTAAVTGVVGLASGLLVPRLIARIPEPEPDDPDDPDDPEQLDEADPEPEEPKQPYVEVAALPGLAWNCLLYTSPSPRDGLLSRMPSSA